MIKEHTQAQRKTNKTIMLSNKDAKSFAVTRFKGMTVLALFLIMTMTAPLQVIYAVQDNDRSISALAQQIVIDRSDEVMTISLDINEMKLSDALEILTSEMGVGLSYSSDTPMDKIVTLQLSDVPFHEALYALLEGTNLEPLLPPTKDVLVIREKDEGVETEIYQETVRGQVVDAQTGEALPGVNVIVQGSSEVTGSMIGTTTDMNGDFEVQVPDGLNTLEFTYIGYQRLEIPIEDRSEFNVEMVSDVQLLEDLVVVGYGTQRRVNLTGSVSSVNTEQLERRTVTQSSQALAGAVSGITVTQGSGRPGEDQASIRIRGLGTFSGAGNDPLVIVDGVPSDINNVNPNNIENISVLKDAASASIYGSRGANGVILITTKKGIEGELQINYDFYLGMQEATELPQKVDSWTYAEMWNEALNNIGSGAAFSQEEIDRFRAGEDPDNYPNKNHLRDLFRSGDGFQTKHDLTLSGGVENIQYLFNIGFLGQNGIIEQNNYNRYDLRLNVNSKLRDNLGLDVKLYGYLSERNEPGMIDGAGSLGGLSEIMRYANSANPNIPGRKSDGTYGATLGHPTAEASLDSDSFGETSNTYFVNDISMQWDIINSLSLTGKVVYSKYDSNSKRFGAEYEANPDLSFGPSMLEVNNSEDDNLNLELLVNYNNTFGIHDLQVLGGISQEEYNSTFMGGYRDNFPNNQLSVLNAGSTANARNFGSESTWKLRSFFGRVNYILQNKYLLEGNVRYDGSSRFAEGNRYGLFSSFSAAWIVSEESFFQVPWIDELKLRGSFGTLGNQQIGTYPYQRTLSLGRSYPTGRNETINPGVQLRRLPFENITWESTKVVGGGIDMLLFNGRLNLIVDYYNKETYDILYNLTVSNVLGMSTGEQNAGRVENKGWDFELRHINHIGDFFYSLNPNFSINYNKVLELANVDRDIGQGLFVGHPLNSIYGYKTDGLFVDQDDIESYADQNYNAEPGFPRYMDISGPEGVPDGRVSSEYDRTVIGNQFPKYSYGLGISAGYKNFDFYTQLHGQGGYQKRLDGLRLAFFNNANIEQWQVDERWTTENPNRNAGYPKLTPLGTLGNYPWGENNSDYWLQDASFLRIKQIQLGYNIPSSVLSNYFINEVRIYIGVENLKSFNNYYTGYDPEMDTGGYAESSYHPLTRMWSGGVNIRF